MKKGFTMIELLGVIVILSILLIIAVPIYNHVGESINKSLYESKIREVLSKSETYAEETGKMVFDIKKLIHEGRLTADNELEEFLDPRNGRNMVCDIINVSYEESYHASVRESEVCYTEEELESMYGMAHLKIVDEEGKEISHQEDTNWLKENKVYVTYELHNENAEVESLIWNGEQEIHCEKDRLESCSFYEVTALSIKTVTVSLKITMKLNGVVLTSQVSKDVLLDIQKPSISQVSYNNDLYTSQNRRVDFEITDGGGSGVREYAIVQEKTCKGSEYNQKKKSVSDGIQTEYLENGEYYICVEDKVGNRTNDSDLDHDLNKIIIDKIDVTSSKIYWSIADFTLGLNDWYRNLSLRANIEETESGVLASNYCITTNESCVPDDHFVNLSGNQFSVALDTNRRPQKACAQIIDKVGNRSEIVCSSFYKVDRTIPTIKSFTASNTWGASNLLTVKAQDTESGIVGYAFSKNNKIPSTFTSVSSSTAVLTFTHSVTSNGTYYVFVKDSAGNVSKKSVSVSYVDKTPPKAKIQVSTSSSNVTVDASGSSDNESGIKTYYYKIDDGSWISSTHSSYVFLGLTDGDHTVCLYVEDRASNVSSPVCSSITVDNWIEFDYPVEKLMSGYHGGSYRILFGMSAKNKTNFKAYISNDRLYGLYTDCQVWKDENNGACTPSGSWYGSKNENTMHASIAYKDGSLGSSHLLSSFQLKTPPSPNRCIGTTSGDTGWQETTVYNPIFYHKYLTNANRYDSPSKQYQKIQFADSITIRYRVVSTDCSCNSSRPDSDTAITCKGHVYARVKVRNYQLQLLTEARLEQYPNATGYLTEENLYTMKPTHMALFVGATWNGSEGSKVAVIWDRKVYNVSQHFS